MLQAVLKGKMTPSYNEDTQTACVFGRLQYLPDEVFWELMKEACPELPNNIGKIEQIDFWPWNDPTGTKNKKGVEPDVIIMTENYYIIIEAKKNDGSWVQDSDQWEREIQSGINEQEEDPKKEIFLIAIGGNNTLDTETIKISGKEYSVHKASWFNLLNSVVKYNKNCNDGCTGRLLGDIIKAFIKHRKAPVDWLENLKPVNISSDSAEVFNRCFSFPYL